jgi:outer membrane protein assembly factor BamB
MRCYTNLAAVVLVCGAFCAPVTGAGRKENPDLDAVLDVMPDIGNRFQTVDELLSEGKWDRVLQKLDQIEEEAGGTVWSEDGQVYVSVREYIRRRIIELPEGGLAYYRVQYDPEAGALLGQGLSKQDVSVLDAVEGRYPASSHAPAALDAAADVLIDRGEYLAAGARLHRLLARPKTEAHSASDEARRAMALAKLGFCLARLGDRSGARHALDRLQKMRARATVRVGDGQKPTEFLTAEMKRKIDAVVRAAAAAWPAPGGHLDHARPMVSVGPGLSRRWSLKIGDDSKPQPAKRTSRGRVYYSRGNTPLEMQVSPTPVSDREGVVYVNTGRGLFAVDHITGRIRWKNKPGEAPEPKNQAGQVIRIRNYANRKLAATWPRWRGAATATVGGGRVYALESMGAGYNIVLALSAFDASSGKRRWSFTQDALAGDFSTGAYFPWAPKYVDGTLIGTAIYRDQMFLAALDAATGTLKWKTFLAADPVRARNIYGRNNIGAWFGQPVVINEHVAYAATGMGAVGAVDVRDGRLLWITRYPRDAVRVNQHKQHSRTYTQYQHLESWQGGFPVLAHGKLYMVAWDAKPLLVFDCNTGQLTKRIARDRFEYFAGIHEGDLLLVGDEAAAVDPHSGLLKWLVPMPFEPQGMPVVTESALVVPAKGKLITVHFGEPAMRRTHAVAGANTGLPLGEVVSCDGRLIAANKGYVTGYFSFQETYKYLSRQMKEDPARVKPKLDRADLCFLHKQYANALRDIRSAEAVLKAQRPPDKALVSRMRRMMFETRLKLSESDTKQAVHHIDAAKPYIFNDIANARFRLARGAALAAEKRYQDAVDEYLHIVTGLRNVKLEEDEATSPVDVIAQARIGELVKKHGHDVYARVDAKLRPKFDALVKTASAEGLREMQLEHPHSSLADNCLFETAKIVQKAAFGSLRAQTVLRSITLRYPRSEVLGEAYAMLLETCMDSKQYRLAAVTLRDIQKKHSHVEIPWGGKVLRGETLVAKLLEEERYKQAMTALARLLPTIRTPLKQAWRSGKGPEALVTVVSDDNCFDRRIGLAVDVSAGSGRYAYYGQINYLRAFDTGTGKDLWRAKVKADWSYSAIEEGISPWSRNSYRAIGVCSGSIVALCHPEGVVAFDVGTGKQVWSRKWKRPQSNNRNYWFDTRQVRMDHRLRTTMNQRPVFAAEAGRIFYFVPDGTLACLDAATGKDIWRTKHPGYGAGPIGLFGELVVVAGITPNTIAAYSALEGKQVYKKSLRGQWPGPPAYDQARNRIFVNDGERLSCHDAADFKRVWESRDRTQSRAGHPWYTLPLAGGKVAVTRYMQKNNQYGYGVAVYDVESGKLVWKYSPNKFVRGNNNSYERTTMYGMPQFGARHAFVPVRHQKRTRSGRTYTHQRDSAVHVIDIGSGKKLRTFAIEAPVAKGRSHSYAYFMGGAAATDHMVVMTREYNRGGQRGKMYVVDGDSGKSVRTDGLPKSFFYGKNRNMMQQRAEPMVTAEGSVLIPTGNGIQCYTSAPPDGKK